MRTLNRYIPENLDLDDLIKNNPPPFQFKKDKALHILSLLTEVPSIADKDFKDGYVPLNVKMLRINGIKDFPIYRDWLIKVGVILTDNQYIVGSKSKGFKFSELYQTPICPIKISCPKQIRRALKCSDKQYKSQKDLNYLHKWFDGLVIDRNSAESYLQAKYQSDVNRGLKKAIMKFNVGLINVDKLANRQFHFNRDDTSGRLHTNLTNIKKELRHFIKYKDQSLVSVDIRNSQPLMASLVLNPKFWRDEKCLIKPLNRDDLELFRYNNTIFKHQQHNSCSIMMSKTMQMVDMQDVVNFNQLSSEGQVYEYIGSELRMNDINHLQEGICRNDLKKMIFQTMFSDNRFYAQDKAAPKRGFKKLFPHVYNLFAAIKSKEKNQLAIILQSIESKLMIDKVAKRIYKERPSLAVFTIHDSITTTLGNEAYVLNVIKEEVNKAIGVTPTCKYEYWSPDNIISSDLTPLREDSKVA